MAYRALVSWTGCQNRGPFPCSCSARLPTDVVRLILNYYQHEETLYDTVVRELVYFVVLDDILHVPLGHDGRVLVVPTLRRRRY